ncbi:hypothetical protein [Muricoccus radiodurans]|uniref:hypothetical protein n=1 Tax=Muricoccus radiodurans TaxID=2231721 RepID=UPI003CEDFFD3
MPSNGLLGYSQRRQQPQKQQETPGFYDPHGVLNGGSGQTSDTSLGSNPGQIGGPNSLGGFTPTTAANIAADLSGRVGGLLGGMPGSILGGAVGVGLQAATTNPELANIGAPTLGPSAVASAALNGMSFGLLGTSIADAREKAINEIALGYIGPTATALEQALRGDITAGRAQFGPPAIDMTTHDPMGQPVASGFGGYAQNATAGMAGLGYAADLSTDPYSGGVGTSGAVGSAGVGLGDTSTGGFGTDGDGFRRGGYTGAGDDGVVQPDRPAGTVHEGEIVIPAEMVQRLSSPALLGLLQPQGLLRQFSSDWRHGGFDPEDPDTPREKCIAMLGKTAAARLSGLAMSAA